MHIPSQRKMTGLLQIALPPAAIGVTVWLGLTTFSYIVVIVLTEIIRGVVVSLVGKPDDEHRDRV